MSTFQFHQQRRLFKFMNPYGFFKIKTSNHARKKQQILDVAYDYERAIPDPEVSGSFISNTDFDENEINHFWAKIIFDKKTKSRLASKIKSLYNDNYTVDVVSSWVSQYYAKTNSEHRLHNHVGSDVNLCAIYYVDLPYRKLLTQYEFNGKLIKPSVKEGEIVFFSSDVLHMSPPNDTKKDKTIVAMNFYLTPKS